MRKHLVVRSDGTGNAFAQHSSNVTTFVKCLDLRTRSSEDKQTWQQTVFYDQGIGTNPGLVKAAKQYRKTGGRDSAELRVLPPPKCHSWIPGFVALLLGLTAGYGLRENVKEMVQALWENYDAGDRVFLIGFSRGAFTVRVVAGFLYCAGLLPKGARRFGAWFDKAYELYALDVANVDRADRIAVFRRETRTRDVETEFMGIWDTVKSYGGICPKSLPHLRHNPSVRTVRHALALNEHRAWFKHTTWGNTREHLGGIPLQHDPRFARQDAKEV
jgi:uncharacterized protein (DUF2235 family)